MGNLQTGYPLQECLAEQPVHLFPVSELTARPEIALRELYYSLFRTTIGSHVQIYNERNYGSVYRNNMKEYLQKRIDE